MKNHYKITLLIYAFLSGCATHCTKGGVWSSYYDTADPRCAYFCADKEENHCAKSKSDAEKLGCCNAQWINDVLDSKVRSGQISKKDVTNQLKLDKHECMLEAFKIPVPSPSCTQQQNYAGHTTNPDCDYSSVRYAEKAQEDVFWSCMSVRNWEQIWVRKADGMRMGSPSDRTIPRD